MNFMKVYSAIASTYDMQVCFTWVLYMSECKKTGLAMVAGPTQKAQLQRSGTK